MKFKANFILHGLDVTWLFDPIIIDVPEDEIQNVQDAAQCELTYGDLKDFL